MFVLQTMPLADHALGQAQWGAVIGASLVAAFFDIREGRIPNWITGPLWASGIVVALLVAGLGGVAESFAATIILALPFVFLWTRGVGGAGDAKLMGALGAWLGLANGIIVLICVVLAGAVLGILFALFRGRLAGVLSNLKSMSLFWALEALRGRLFSSRGNAPAGNQLAMPYAVSILCGVLTAALGVMLWRAKT